MHSRARGSEWVRRHTQSEVLTEEKELSRELAEELKKALDPQGMDVDVAAPPRHTRGWVPRDLRTSPLAVLGVVGRQP